MSDKFKRIIRTRPPFDKRDADPKKSYGIGGMNIWFILQGDKGAVQFAMMIGAYLDHVADELLSRAKPLSGEQEKEIAEIQEKYKPGTIVKYNGDNNEAAFTEWAMKTLGNFKDAIQTLLAYTKVQGSNQCMDSTAKFTAMDLGYHSPVPRYDDQPSMECELLEGGKCYYDGSGLNAEPVLSLYLEGGDKAVWARLEDYYQSVFGESSDDK